MLVELFRIEKSGDGVFGVLRVNGKLVCNTLEDPDNGNKPGESCIPPGDYDCVRVISPKFGDTFLVSGVPGRSEILFHAGNTIMDTRGCILLGKGTGAVHNRRGIITSKEAMKEFKELMIGSQGFRLSIKEV